MSDDGSTPSERELDRMDVHELGRLGASLDDVEIVDDSPRVPPGSTQERRVVRRISAWFGLAVLGGIGFVVVYVVWPWQFTGVGTGPALTNWYTPLLGITFAITVGAVAIGVVRWTELLVSRDIAVQQRHDGPSSPLAQRTAAARFVELGEQTGVSRHKLLRRTVLAAGTAIGGVLAVVVIGSTVRTPFAQEKLTSPVRTRWLATHGERVYLRMDTGDPHSVTLVRPDDLAPGGMLQVFPFRESDRGDPEALSEALRDADSPVVLVRFFPGTPIVKRAGQEDFNYGPLYAYSKVCTHMGCPVYLFEEVTLRLLCPCHQTEFQANEYARPVFGPGARPLPQLPIDVDETGYLYARSDFIEPVGPGFWNRKPLGT